MIGNQRATIGAVTHMNNTASLSANSLTVREPSPGRYSLYLRQVGEGRVRLSLRSLASDLDASTLQLLPHASNPTRPSRGGLCPILGKTRRSNGPAKNLPWLRGRLRRVYTVGLALQGDSRHRDLGLRRQTLLDGFHCRVAGRKAVTMAIGLDRHRDEIRVVERACAALEGGIVERPMR